MSGYGDESKVFGRAQYYQLPEMIIITWESRDVRFTPFYYLIMKFLHEPTELSIFYYTIKRIRIKKI